MSGPNGTPGKVELLRDVDIVVQIEAVRVQVVVAEAEFVDQVIAKSVDLTGGQAPGRVIAVAILKAAAVQHVVERRGQKKAVVAITEAGEKIVLSADGVVDADVELVFGFAALGIGKEGLEAELRSIGRGKQRRQTRRQRINARRAPGTGRKDVGRDPA